MQVLNSSCCRFYPWRKTISLWGYSVNVAHLWNRGQLHNGVRLWWGGIWLISKLSDGHYLRMTAATDCYLRRCFVKLHNLFNILRQYLTFRILVPKIVPLQYLKVTHGGDCNKIPFQINQTFKCVFFMFQVQEDSPALRAGLEPFFDFILSIGNTRLVSKL